MSNPESRGPTTADAPGVHEIRFYFRSPAWVAAIGDERRGLAAVADHPFEAVRELVRKMYNLGWEV